MKLGRGDEDRTHADIATGLIPTAEAWAKAVWRADLGSFCRTNRRHLRVLSVGRAMAFPTRQARTAFIVTLEMPCLS
jgi:hypothetical protein